MSASKIVIQFTTEGDFVAKYSSISEAAEAMGCARTCINDCCVGKSVQCCGYLWTFSNNQYKLKEIADSLFRPSIPIEWGSEWKDVLGFDGVYKVSNYGIVISMPRLTRRSERFIYKPLTKKKPQKDSGGYQKINLYKDGVETQLLLHRIVAMAFIPNPKNLPCVNHKDEDKTNNNPTNLEWCTVAENNRYGTHSERSARKNINGKLSKAILQYNFKGILIREFPSIAEAVRCGFSSQMICGCCKGKYKNHKGFIWKYK